MSDYINLISTIILCEGKLSCTNNGERVTEGKF